MWKCKPACAQAKKENRNEKKIHREIVAKHCHRGQNKTISMPQFMFYCVKKQGKIPSISIGKVPIIRHVQFDIEIL